MSIVEPGKRPARRFRSSKVLGGRLQGGRRRTNAELNVVPMVDMMTMLVIFLLQQFSATGEVLYMQKDIKLPDARHGQQIEIAPVISISPEQLVVSGQKVANLADLEKQPSQLVEPLVEKLRDEKKKWDFIHQNDADREKNWKGDVNVQADVKVPFRVVRCVLASASEAGYDNVNFATMEEHAVVAAASNAAR
ncbi:MAG TPA: biopolymer transporter ExbD [Anaeromyxobacteraceae bacterium]|nr:biopolymer transporter ExbD [Anaeromyxobacteraceae bacterium]